MITSRIDPEILPCGQNFEENKKRGTEVPPEILLEKFPDALEEAFRHRI